MLTLFTGFIVLCFFQYAFAQESSSEKRVLVILSDSSRIPANKMFIQGIEERMGQLGNSLIQYSYEFLDWAQFSSDSSYIDNVGDSFRKKYKNFKPDFIVAAGHPAAQLILKIGADTFQNVPVVFVQTNLTLPLLAASNNPVKAAIVLSPYDGRKAVELILRLQPKTQTIYIVTGDSERDRQFIANDFSEIHTLANRVKIVYLKGYAVAQLLDKIRSIAGDEVILYSTVLVDGAGKFFVPADVLRRITGVARVPVYGMYDSHIGTGSIGGYLKSARVTGAKVAEIGTALLDGKVNARTTMDESETNEYAFDWRELKRWKINEELLPPGSRVEFKEQDIWTQYKWRILGGISLLLLQSLLIFGFLVNRAVRKRSEMKLHKRETELTNERLRSRLLIAGLETSSNLVVILDARRSIWWVNTAFESLSGFSLDEIIGEDSRRILSEQNDPEILLQVKDAMAHKRKWRGEIIACSKDGRNFIDEISVTPILDETGEPSYFLIVGLDVTEKSQAREALLAAQKLQVKAEKIFSIGTMATGISHEINQPLTSIKMISGGMLYLFRKGGNLPTDELIAGAEAISEQADRITGIIKHLRSFIRRSENKLVLCSVNEAVDQALGLVGKRLDAHGITLHKQLDASLPLVWAHPMGLEEVIVNLLINAMEALDTVEIEDKQIVVKTYFADSVILEISDNGPGIDPQMRETIFEPFVSSKVDGENMGLGLAIVKSILSSYLGTIQLTADGAEGVKFRIELPLNRAESEGEN